MHQHGQREQSAGSTFQKSPATTLVRVLSAALIVLACAMIASLVYAARKSKEASAMAASQAQLARQVQQSQDDLATLKQRLDAAQAAAQTATRPSPAGPVVRKRNPTHSPAPARVGATRNAADEARWRKVQEQIAANQQNIDRARIDLEGQLSTTRTELNGSIAKTHDDLVALQKRGEENYFEFDLTKSKQFVRQGPISIALRKANTKHQNYNVDLIVDDSKVSKKNVNIYEPIRIYPGGTHRPVELVVNQITKDHVHGYVSAPKYSETDLAQNTNQQNSFSVTGNDQANPEGASASKDSRTALQRR
jgi:hypothetical protein